VTVVSDEPGKLIEHCLALVPASEVRLFSWEVGPLWKRMPEFRVCRIRPTNVSSPWIYLSLGMSLGEGPQTELVLLSQQDNARHVETLAMLADEHLTGRHTLAPGCLLRVGRGWEEGSPQTDMLISLPYPFGPAFEKAPGVRILWALPITPAERLFAEQAGVPALEQLFDAAAIDAVDPFRPDVVGGAASA